MLSKSNYIRAATLIRREISGECLQTVKEEGVCRTALLSEREYIKQLMNKIMLAH